MRALPGEPLISTILPDLSGLVSTIRSTFKWWYHSFSLRGLATHYRVYHFLSQHSTLHFVYVYDSKPGIWMIVLYYLSSNESSKSWELLQVFWKIVCFFFRPFLAPLAGASDVWMLRLAPLCHWSYACVFLNQTCALIAAFRFSQRNMWQMEHQITIIPVLIADLRRHLITRQIIPQTHAGNVTSKLCQCIY